MSKYDVEANCIAKKAGKKVKEIILVTAEANKDDFAINSAILNRVKKMGYSIGSMQRDDPRGIAHTDYSIAKWRNIPLEEYHKLEGVVLCSDNRNGGEGAIVVFE